VLARGLIRARSGAADGIVKTRTGVSAPCAAASIQSCSSRSGPSALLLPKTSSMLVGADAWVRPMLCAMAAGGALVRQGIVVAW
jgi:hypothetical protein